MIRGVHTMFYTSDGMNCWRSCDFPTGETHAINFTRAIGLFDGDYARQWLLVE